ncbi:MAG TPA: amino acid racemase [Anaerolineales bacterium]|nr:amino acid racemase [Anaerolineales bacterium]
MKTVGIIGGIGPESTIVYYRSILAAYREQRPDGSAPSILINSIDLTKMLALIGKDQLTEVTDYLVEEVNRLARAGADFGLSAANTPHIVFDDVQRQSPIPLISIVKAACDEAQHLGLKKIGLFGIRPTMQGRFYPTVFSKAGMTLSLPETEEQDFIHGIYMNELVNGIVLSKTRERLLIIIEQMIDRHSIDGFLLAGTELSLILNDDQHNGIPVLNTTLIHVKRVIAELLL